MSALNEYISRFIVSDSDFGRQFNAHAQKDGVKLSSVVGGRILPIASESELSQLDISCGASLGSSVDTIDKLLHNHEGGIIYRQDLLKVGARVPGFAEIIDTKQNSVIASSIEEFFNFKLFYGDSLDFVFFAIVKKSIGFSDINLTMGDAVLGILSIYDREAFLIFE